MDFIDILRGRFYATYSGKYFYKLPSPVNITREEDLYKIESAKPFEYEYVDATSWQYKQLLANLVECEGATTAIKTTTPHEWKNGAFVILQDGRLFVIRSVTRDERESNVENARFMMIPRVTSYVIGLVERENPWEIK